MPKQTKSPKPSKQSAKADLSGPFIVRWNELVSVTNWEKGRIICDWRSALEKKRAPAADYSDGAWADRIEGVTAQHVGRLRRVYDRFSKVHDQYEGLYWTHFQVALDWEDAEMWLEGAVQNKWSVSQMRAQRWETYGAPDSLKPRDEDIIVAELDEDSGTRADDASPVTARTSAVRGVGKDGKEAADTATKKRTAAGEDSSEEAPSSQSADAEAATSTPKQEKRRQPFAALPTLPADVTDAFEQFKLVILNHKHANWSDITCDDMLACLDALRELALLPAGE